MVQLKRYAIPPLNVKNQPRGLAVFPHAGTLFYGRFMVDIDVRQVVVECRYQFDVKSPYAVIQAHPTSSTSGIPLINGVAPCTGAWTLPFAKSASNRIYRLRY